MQQSWDDDEHPVTTTHARPDGHKEVEGDFEQGKTTLMPSKISTQDQPVVPASQTSRKEPVSAPSPQAMPAQSTPTQAMGNVPVTLPVAALLGQAAAPPPLETTRPQGPPPMPPPLQVTPPGIPEASIFFDESSPALPLPDFQHLSQEKPLTLLPQKGEALLATEQIGTAKWPYVLLTAVVLVGGLLATQYQQILAWLVPPAQQNVALPQGPSPAERAKALYAAGAAAYEQKNYAGALKSFQEALVQDPNFAPIHRGLGIVYAVEKRQEDALRHYQQYLILAPQAEDAEQVRQIVKEGAMAMGKQAQQKQEVGADAQDNTQTSSEGVPSSQGSIEGKKIEDRKKGKLAKGKSKGKRGKS